MKKVLFIFRKLLLCILLMQLINLSLCSESYWEYYNYSDHSTIYDPTETFVEWVVELKNGNQDAFSYHNSINLKGLCKSFAWHVDTHHHFVTAYLPQPATLRLYIPHTCDMPVADCQDILSPPPEPYASI